MSFASPLWLIALVPWAAVAVWLFQGRRPRAWVPYLALWQSGAPVPRPKRKIQVLPLGVLMALLAALCCIVGAAQPSVASRDAGGATGITLIIDRGLTMSAMNSGAPRYVKATGTLVDALPTSLRSAQVELVRVPGGDPVRTTFAECRGVIEKISPTARDTSRLLPEAVSVRLAARDGPVIVVTDRSLPPRDGLIQVVPEGNLRDVGIALIAARQSPTREVMVRVRNQSSLSKAELVISSVAGIERQAIELPKAGRTQDYFVNSAQLGNFIRAQLALNDDLPANNTAWLVREGNSPRIEAMTTLDPALTRLIAAYQSSRPPADESARLTIVNDVAQLPPSDPAVVLPQARGSQVAGPARIVPHAITEHVDWGGLPSPIAVGDPPAGWMPVVSVGDHPIVTIGAGPSRKVWVGFDPGDWSRTADYVVFWTNVFDWAGGGGARYVAHPLSEWTSEWKPTKSANPNPGMWPGLYRRSDGALRAFNAPDVILPAPATTEWRAQLAALASSTGRTELSGRLFVIAAGCLVIAAATWQKRRPPEK